MDNFRHRFLPFYLVVDVSYSMEGEKLAAADRILPAVVDALAQNPILVDIIKFGLIDFSDEARVQLPLCDVLDPMLTLPSLSSRGGTSYTAALNTIVTELEGAVASLTSQGFVVHRPVVWFISDGEPSDDEEMWQRALSRLRELSEAPNFIPCAVDGADLNLMASLASRARGAKSMPIFAMDRGFDAGRAIAGLAEVLISSILHSGSYPRSGDSAEVLPKSLELPDGLTMFDPDDFV